MTPRLLAAFFTLVLLSGCVTDGVAPEPKVVVHEVPLPVPVACAADPGPDPEYVDTEAALAGTRDLFARVQILLAGRKQRIGRELELKAANAGCRGSGPLK